MQERAILLVEDDPKDLELTLTAVRMAGSSQRVNVTSNGEEALDYLYRRGKFGSRTEGNPALVLLDLKLPLVSGFEVLRAIKSDASLQPIPVVMLSSSQEEADIDGSYRLGANGYVVKPLDFSDYVASVTSICSYWIAFNQPPSVCTA